MRNLLKRSQRQFIASIKNTFISLKDVFLVLLWLSVTIYILYSQKHTDKTSKANNLKYNDKISKTDIVKNYYMENELAKPIITKMKFQKRSYGKLTCKTDHNEN